MAARVVHPSSPPLVNRAKQLLKQGQPVFTFEVYEFIRPSVVKLAAECGFHMISVEGEHVWHNPERLTDFMVAARDNGLATLVSVPTGQRHFVSRVLDAGAWGIMLPHAETHEQVEDLVRWVKYPPMGQRAIVFGPNCDYHEPNDISQFCVQSNEATLIMLKIESRAGVENAEVLLANPAVDAVCFGPVDLSADFGVAGQVEHPDLLAAMKRVMDIAMAHSVAVAGGAPDSATYQSKRKQGVQIFGSGSELTLLRASADAWMRLHSETT